MKCPDCGTQMNHHADKVDYDVALEDPSLCDADLGGVLEEVHACPACGQVEIQTAGGGVD